MEQESCKLQRKLQCFIGINQARAHFIEIPFIRILHYARVFIYNFKAREALNNGVIWILYDQT